MAGTTSTLRTALLNHVFKGLTPFNTTYIYTYVSLHQADPGDAGSWELTGYGGYNRKYVDNTGTGWNVSVSPQSENYATGPYPSSSELTWDASAVWPTVQYGGIYNTLTGGSLYFSFLLSSYPQLNNGDQLTLNFGSISFFTY